MSKDNQYHLRELKGSNYEIVDGEPDIIGWNISDGNGYKIGEVHDLLFDPETRRVHYLIVDLDKDYASAEKNKKVLVPIGIAHLHGRKTDHVNTSSTGLEPTPADETIYPEAEAPVTSTDLHPKNKKQYDLSDTGKNLVVLPNATPAQLQMLPEYDRDLLSSDQENIIRNIFESGTAAGLAAGEATDFDRTKFYSHDYYNEDRFYQPDVPAREDKTHDSASSIPIVEENIQVDKQQVQTGGIRATSRIVERPVEEDIRLQTERVNVERTPVDRPVTDSDEAFKEIEIELTEHEEVPVVQKEARVVEEISLHKETDEKEETIRDTVRKTEVDIEKLSGEDKINRTDEEEDENDLNRSWL